MKQTCKTDKNGKEIYEGDIVTFIDYDRAYECEFINTGTIEFFHNAFVITNRNDVNMEDIDFETEVEVIGNKFENPELLTA